MVLSTLNNFDLLANNKMSREKRDKTFIVVKIANKKTTVEFVFESFYLPK